MAALKRKDKIYYDTSTSHLEPSTLPPTSAAEKYHILRVDYHIMCLKRKYATIKPEECGLYIVAGKMSAYAD